MKLTVFVIAMVFAGFANAQAPKNGPCQSVVLGEVIANESWVYISTSDNKAYKADGSNAAKIALGLVYVGGNANDTTQIFFEGENPWTTTSLVKGTVYYLSPTTSGNMTGVRPTGYGFTQPLCFALTDSTIYIMKHNVDYDRTHTVLKAGDENRANTTTLTDDMSLSLALRANRKYMIELYAVINIDNENMDYKYDLNFTGSTTVVHGWRGHSVAGSGNGTDKENVSYTTSLPGSTSVTGTTFGLAIVRANYYMAIGATPGSLSFRWAQNTTDPGNATVYSGSWLKATEIE